MTGQTQHPAGSTPGKTLSDIAEALKEVTALLNRFLGSGLQEAGEMVGNRLRVFRLKQELKLLRKATAILKEAGLTPKAVSLRVLFPLLDAAVLEEDEEMAERWASLLATAADPNNKSCREASFVEILKQLAPSDAFLLDVFYEQIERYKLPPEQWNERGVVRGYLQEMLQEEVPRFDIAIDNLLRLHLVEHPVVKLGVANGNDVRCQVASSNILCPTSLGQAFVSACGRGRTPRSVSYGVPGDSISNVFSTEGGSVRLWSKEEEAAWQQHKRKNGKKDS